jgi:hypothetical protein
MQRFVLTLLLAVTLCSQLGHCFKAVFTNRIDEQHVKCNHSTTYPCYTKLYIPGPEFEGGIDTDSQNDRGRTFVNHVRYTYDVCDGMFHLNTVSNFQPHAFAHSLVTIPVLIIFAPGKHLISSKLCYRLCLTSDGKQFTLI